MTLRQELQLLIDRHCTCTWVDREMLIDEILRILAREKLALVQKPSRN
jgi:hypothetical protein